MKNPVRQQGGYAWLPVLIVVAVLGILGGGSTLYQNKLKQQAEVEALKQETAELKQVISNEEEQVDVSPTPALESSPSPVPEVKAAVTAAPANNTTATSPASSELNVPLIVEEEFEKVYGRKPTGSESDYWKNRVRSNSWSRSELYNAIFAIKPAPPATVVVTSPPQTNTTTQSTSQSSTSSSSEELDEYLLDKYKQEEQEQAAQQAALRAQAEARAICLANYNNQLSQLLDELIKKEAEINSNPWISESLRIGKINQAREEYNTEQTILSNRASLECN